MRENVVVQVGGLNFHPEEYAAPIGWARTTGDRIDLSVWGYEGLWCEITNDQPDFLFENAGLGYLLVTQGFRNGDFNGHVHIPVEVVMGSDPELKAWMKERGLPSCTRYNLRAGAEKHLRIKE